MAIISHLTTIEKLFKPIKRRPPGSLTDDPHFSKITSYFTLLANATSITYDLMNDLHVDSIVQRTKKLSFIQQDNTLQINFATSMNAGPLDSVSVYYQGIPANTGFGSFVNS